MVVAPALLRSVVARRIFVMFLLCAVLPVCALAVISLQQVYGTMQKSSQERLRQANKNVGMSLAEGLYLVHSELLNIAHSARPGENPHRAETDKDEERLRALTFFDERGGRQVVFGAECPRPQLPAGGAQHLAAGRALLFRGSASGGPEHLYLAVRGKSLLLVAEINQEYLWALVRNTLPSEMDLAVIDMRGTVLFSSSSSPTPFASRVIERHALSSVGQFEWDHRGEEAFVNYWSVFLKPLYLSESWIVVASQKNQIMLQPVRSFLRTFALVILLTLIVVGYLSSILIRRNLVPLETLRDGTQQLSRGNLDARVTLASGDEFEELATTFNGMADHLQRQFSTMRDTGLVVQQILSAPDRASIIQAVMAARLSAIPCDVLALSLVHPVIADTTITYRSRGGAAGECESHELVSTHSSKEWELLAGIPDYLHVSDAAELPSLLLPVRDAALSLYYLFPFALKNSLAGVLVVGYRERPAQLHEELTRGRSITNEIAVALEKVRLIEELNRLNWGTIRSLANAVDAKSPWTAGHSERVTRLAVRLGRELGLHEQEIELLQIGGMFHDIGKIAVPEAILDKREALDSDEFDIIKSHPEMGARILEPISAYEKVVPMVIQHHERYDGSGYPYGLSGDDISIGGRILAVADVYDALFSERPYREGWEHERVLSYIRLHSGQKFDPLVVGALDAVFRQAEFDVVPGDREPMNIPEVWQI